MVYVIEMAAPTCQNTRNGAVFQSPLDTPQTTQLSACRHCLVLNTNLIVNRVELGQHDAVNKARICHLRVIGKRLVELHQLINSFVPDKCLAHEQHQVRLVHRDQLQAVQHDVIMTNLK